MKVFGIGLNKTGTYSLSQALKRLGFPCLHNPSESQVKWLLNGGALGPFVAACDYQVRAHWRELVERFPDARYVLTTRPKEDWISSRLLQVYAERVLRGGQTWDGIATGEDALLYNRHHEAVRDHFAGRSNFVELPLGAGWGPLCGLLGRPMPAEPYPHCNSADETLRRLLAAKGRPTLPFAVEPSTEISHRADFSILANARGYKDAVEVGTDLGRFAKEFMARFEGHWLVCVDPYLPHPDFDYTRDGDLMTAVQALGLYHGRVRFVRAMSTAAAPWVGSVIRPDFVYIDAGHRDDEVTADLLAWWDVLAPEGMLAGHDWDADHEGVSAAVTRFAQERGLVVRLTHETTSPPSWYCYKTEPSELMIRFFRDGTAPNPHFRGGR